MSLPLYLEYLALRHSITGGGAIVLERGTGSRTPPPFNRGLARAARATWRPPSLRTIAMELFRCAKCGCEEGTAHCNYWSARIRQTAPLCSFCDPKIRKWHGEFPRKCEEVSFYGGGTHAIKLRTKVLDLAAELEDIRRAKLFL